MTTVTSANGPAARAARLSVARDLGTMDAPYKREPRAPLPSWSVVHNVGRRKGPNPDDRYDPGGRSVEDRALGARALELVEAGGAGHEHGAVPEPPGGLALGGRSDDRTEERHPVDRHDRRADVLTDLGDALLVAGAQQLVVLGGVGRLDQLRREPDLLQGTDYGGAEVLLAARVQTRADRVVQLLDDVLAVLLAGGDDDPHRTPRLLHHLEVLLGQVTPLVEHRQAHDVPAHLDVADLLGLADPP